MPYYDIEISDEAESFLRNLGKSTRDKFLRAFDKVKLGIIREEYFKKLTATDGLWEFRVQDNNSWYRILAYMGRYEGDDYTTIITLHGFEKKGNKTPSHEIKKAERRKRDS